MQVYLVVHITTRYANIHAARSAALIEESRTCYGTKSRSTQGAVQRCCRPLTLTNLAHMATLCTVARNSSYAKLLASQRANEAVALEAVSRAST